MIHQFQKYNLVYKMILVGVFSALLSLSAFAAKGGGRGGGDTGGGSGGGEKLNQSPVALSDQLPVKSDLSSASINLLDNDSDPDIIKRKPETFSLTSVFQNSSQIGLNTWYTTQANARVYVSSAGVLTYNPNGKFNHLAIGQVAQENLYYIITDARGASAQAQVTVTIQGTAQPNSAPVARADSFVTYAGQAISGNVLSNDSDIDGDPISVSSFSSTSQSGGLVNMSAGGNFTYTPANQFSGTDSFGYTITDGKGLQSSSLVSISVQPQTVIPYYISALMVGTNYRLNYGAPIGTPTTVTFAFLEAVPNYYSATDSVRNGFISLTSTQKTRTREALESITSFCGLSFVETSVEEAEMVFGMANIGSSGLAYVPSGDGVGNISSDVWLDDGFVFDNFMPGSTAYKTLIHEIGHALGLSHPILPAGEENRQYSVMAGYRHPTMGVEEPSTHMLFDIATLQYLYGSNSSSSSLNDTYNLSDFAGIVQTLWDSGGQDSLNFGLASYNLNLNLQPGSFSSVTPVGTNNLAIAFSTTIEVAIAGSGNDRLTGNKANNTLTGGSGSDEFVFHASWGQDTITDFKKGEDKINLSSLNIQFSNLVISASGSDLLISYQGNTLLLKNVTSVTSADFVFGG